MNDEESHDNHDKAILEDRSGRIQINWSSVFDFHKLSSGIILALKG
jgi:hypothetical protein